MTLPCPLQQFRTRAALLSWCLASALASTSIAHAEPTGYVYAYFKGGWPTGGSSGVFLSFSTDGLNFTPLNNDGAVITPPQAPDFPAGENQMRDPSVVYGPDGKFHMVWTTGITAKTIGYASSEDLVTWSAPKRIEVWGPEVNVANTWAPELYYDEEQQKYLVVWASNLNNGLHKLYSFTTTDFNSFTSPQEFYYAGQTVIDGMIARDEANDRYLMAVKDELNGFKNVWLATSDAAQGPYVRGDAPVIGPGSAIEPNAVEGPSLIKIGDAWQLHYDAYGAGYLGVATSTDLETWVNRTSEAKLPSTGNPHHGTVFAVPISAIGWELPFEKSDLNDDGAINLDDWSIFRANHLADLSGLSPNERAARGDLNGDGRVDFDDFREFQGDFNFLNGAGAFARMLAAVPEPSAGPMLFSGVAIALWHARLRN
jgi:sucrose-6-phosphate hydrolase SacC (GH32 family)